MFRRFRLVGIASVTVLALGVFSATSMAAPKDDAARKLDDNAMNNDFLDMEFGRAEANLKKAIATCGDNGCSPSVKAQIQVHLGIVQFNNGNPAGAEQSFVEALQTHPSVVLDRDFASPDLQKIFDAAKGRTSSSVAAPPDVEPSGGGDTGDIDHQPLAEQMVNTPVPIWVTIPDDMGVDRVVVRYKPFGGEWKKVNLKKGRRNVWSALIDCNEVTTTGDLKYYIMVLDESGDSVTSLGSLTKPFVIKIKNQLDGDPPSLPNEPPPARCAAKEDCPPGLPGCPAAGRGNKGAGEECESTRECRAGFRCEDWECVRGEETSSGPYKKNWVSLSFSLDLAVLSGDDVCGRESQQSKGYSCFTKVGSYEDAGGLKKGAHYHGRPYPSGNGNAIDGGVGLATMRILLGYDRVLIPNLTIGARAGVAFNGGPQPDSGNAFLPVHLEGRAAYWFGSDPFANTGFRPFVFVGGGMAQVDSMVEVSVREDESAVQENGNPWVVCDKGTCNVDDAGIYPDQQFVEAWRKAGQGFVGLGGGVMYAIAPNHGPMFELKFSYLFPTTNIVISPTIGYGMGF